MIKSGGEWISSMELENLIMGYPGVAEAAVIGVPDETCGERPLAAAVPADGAALTAAELREFLTERLPRWQVPERWCFIEEVPKTSVGKFAKTRMRDAYARSDYAIIEARWPRLAAPGRCCPGRERRRPGRGRRRLAGK
ncbi:MAG: AMP-binding enzyme [Streptosporangiaceae bacterium]